MGTDIGERTRERVGAETDGGGRPLAQMRSCLVTGAAGYFGLHLTRALLARGLRVHAFDLQPPDLEGEGLTCFQGDVRNRRDLLEAAEGVDTVFHVAAIVKLFRHCTESIRRQSFEVNVAGTELVIEVCRELGIERLVYTSSNNVIFDGRPIELADESLPYPDHYVDIYSETKSLAERMVLAANGSDGLLTCAIRPSGIYGPGEKMILPRIVGQCHDGLLLATLGGARARTEFSYVDNLTHGHILAAQHLLPDSPAAGQAYFINDGYYTSSIGYFRPLIEGLGFRFPERTLPTGLMRAIAVAWEMAHRYLRAPEPMFTCVEVLKAAVSHPCSIEKARRELGYEPPVSHAEAMDRCLGYAREIVASRDRLERPHAGWWVSILAGMVFLGLLAHDPTVWAWWSQSIMGAIPHWLYQAGFWTAVLTHVHKGLKAVRLAERAGFHRSSAAWGWQTFILGFPSLALLVPRAEAALHGEAGSR